MADESNKPIESALKACAEKRRAEAGAPLEMHPATRRLLQGEVVRTYDATRSTAGEPRSWWRALRPRLVFIGGTAAALVLVAALLLPSLAKSKSKSARIAGNRAREEKTIELAKQNEPESLARREVLAKRVELAARPTSAVEARQDRGEIAREAVVDKLSTTPAMEESDVTVRAPSLLTVEQVPTEAKVVADAKLESIKPTADAPSLGREIKLGLAYGKKDGVAELSADGDLSRGELRSFAVNDEAIAAPPPAPPASSGVGGRGGITSAPAGAFAAAQLQNRYGYPAAFFSQAYRNQAPAKQPGVVLANFRVEQTGSQVRVVDGDGSAYEGVVMTPAEFNALENSAAGDRLQMRAKSEEVRQQLRSLPTEPLTQNSPANTLYFRVSGTNRTLNQPVVFEGTGSLPVAGQALDFRELTEATQNNAARGFTNQAQLQQLWDNAAGIRGRAVVAGTNEFQVDAVPAEVLQQNRAP